jgi:outer membrane protein
MRLPLIALLLCCLPPAAPAAESEPPPRWTFGAMAIQRDAPYRGYDEGLWGVPLLRFEGERAYVRGLRAGVVLAERGGFSFGPVAQLRTEGYDADKSDFLAGMDDRDFSVDAGVAAAWRDDDVGQFELSAVTDVLDRSGGEELELGYTALFRAGGFTFVPQLAVRWQDEDLVDYYYGVRPDEALPGRPEYHPGSALTPELSVLAQRPLSKRWTLFARVGHMWLPSEVRDSPIVDDAGRTTLALGVGYSPD